MEAVRGLVDPGQGGPEAALLTPAYVGFVIGRRDTRIALLNGSLHTARVPKNEGLEGIIRTIDYLAEISNSYVEAVGFAGTNGKSGVIASAIWEHFTANPYPIPTDGLNNGKRVKPETVAEQTAIIDQSQPLDTSPVLPSRLATYNRYVENTPRETVDIIRYLAIELEDVNIIEINSARIGGGVAKQIYDKQRAVGAFNEAEESAAKKQRKRRDRKIKPAHIDDHWVVMTGKLDSGICEELGLDPNTNPWDTTKWMHNANQARTIDPFTDHHRKVYEALTRTNERYLDEQIQQLKEKSAQENDCKEKQTVYIIHDAQPLKLIKHLKEKDPNSIILWRLHIELKPDLIADPTTIQHQVWDFLHKQLKDDSGNYLVDAVEVHPALPEKPDQFLPKGQDALDPSLVVLRPATTSPYIDGLTKELNDRQQAQYIIQFNEHLIETGQIPLDSHRPVVGTVHRFDESKNSEGTLEAFRLLRKKMQEEGILKENTPQLIIAGNPANDDTSGLGIYYATLMLLRPEQYDFSDNPLVMKMYNSLFANLNPEEFRDIRDDIKIARLPPKDQLLNAVGETMDVYLQISHAEGCEVAVMEQKMKIKPVIGSHRGGIARQIKHGEDGYVVEPDAHQTIADHLYDLFTNPDLYQQMSIAARENVDPEYHTLADLRDWLMIIDMVRKGRFRTVVEEQRKKLGRPPLTKEIMMVEYGHIIANGQEKLSTRNSSRRNRTSFVN